MAAAVGAPVLAPAEDGRPSLAEWVAAGWLNTYTGAKILPLDFTPEMVRLKDIAHGLAGKMRYQAQTWLSVAQHSVAVLAVVERLAPGLSPHDARFVLFHDGSEAYLPDMPAPIKRDERFAWFLEVEAQVQAAVYEAMQVDIGAVRDEVKVALKTADKMVRNAEKRFFQTVHPDWREAVPTPIGLVGVLGNFYSAEWAPQLAKRRFLEVAAKVRA